MQEDNNNNNHPQPAALSQPPKQPSHHWLYAHHSKPFVWAVVGLAELIILVGVFALGLSIGFHKAGFTYSWEKNYRNNFGGPIHFDQQAPPTGLNAFGVDGTILSTGNGSLVIKDESGTEKTIITSPATTIRQDFQNLAPSDLKANEEILVIGDPNSQGQIAAKLIRVIK